MQGYKDLEIYQLAHSLAVDMHTVTLQLPSFEQYEEGSQIRRSSKSISANIVEGFSKKRYTHDYIRYLIIAHASCNETIEHLDLLYETKSLSDSSAYAIFSEKLDKLARKINTLIHTIIGAHA